MVWYKKRIWREIQILFSSSQIQEGVYKYFLFYQIFFREFVEEKVKMSCKEKVEMSCFWKREHGKYEIMIRNSLSLSHIPYEYY